MAIAVEDDAAHSRKPPALSGPRVCTIVPETL